MMLQDHFNRFDPSRLRPAASLNRSVIPNQPHFPFDLIGRSGYDLLSSQAFAQQICYQTGAKLNPIQYLSEAFTDPDCINHKKAQEIAQAYGENLGYFITALTNPPIDGMVNNTSWESNYKKHWAKIQKVYLGGGLAAAVFGTAIVDAAGKIVEKSSPRKVTVQLSDMPQLLPLVGTARSISETRHEALVFDFGQSWVKRGAAKYTKGKLSGMKILPPVSASDVVSTDIHQLAQFMSDTIVQTHHEMPKSIRSAKIAISIASYLRNGQPYAYQGGLYAQLRLISDPFQDWLEGAVSKRLGTDMVLKLLHDGTAAAQRYAEETNTAVMMLGTALGVGFTSRSEDLTPISKKFKWR